MRIVALRLAWMVALCITSLSLKAASDVKVESLRAVNAPDGTRKVVVDHLFPVVDGEPERYSGRMMIRVVDADGTTTRQRYMETSQIRLISPGKWVDDKYFVFSYDISKNSRGTVALNANTGQALQVEAVITSRRMGATNTIETEFTDLEIADYGDTVTRIRNVTRNQRSIFPVYLSELGFLTGKPMTPELVADVQNAVQASREFLETRQISELTIEEASESFNPSETHMCVLACVGGNAAAVIVPMNAPSALDAMKDTHVVALGSDVKLTCQAEADPLVEPTEDTEMTTEPETATEQFGGLRYTTSWKNEGTAVIEKETFGDEEENAHREPLYHIGVDGKLETVGAAERKASSTAPAPVVEDEKPAKKTEQTSPTVKRETKKETTERKPSEPARTPRVSRATATPAVTASPSPSPTPRRGLLRRILPGGRSNESQ